MANFSLFFRSWPNELMRSLSFIILYRYFGAWNDFRIPSQILYSVFAASVLISSSMIIGKAAAKTKEAIKTAVDEQKKSK